MKLIILRGLPGSGKSTYAKKIAPDSTFASDDYFMVAGVYCFDPSRLKDAHRWNQWRVEQALKIGKWNTVCVANTNILVSHMIPYIASALKHKYSYDIVEDWDGKETRCLQCFERCQHTVPLSTIERMERQFEKLEDVACDF